MFLDSRLNCSYTQTSAWILNVVDQMRHSLQSDCRFIVVIAAWLAILMWLAPYFRAFILGGVSGRCVSEIR